MTYHNYYKKMYFFSSLYIRMSGKSVNFDDEKIKKSEFNKNKKVTSVDDIENISF